MNKDQQTNARVIFDFSAIMVPKLIDNTNYLETISYPNALDFRIFIRMTRNALDTEESSTDITATFVYCDPIWTGNGGANFIYA